MTRHDWFDAVMLISLLLAIVSAAFLAIHWIE